MKRVASSRLPGIKHVIPTMERREDPCLCLGIESTAHTFGASIVDGTGNILSDVRSVYVPSVGKGIHPREASQHHSEVCHSVIAESLKKAGVAAKDLSAIAVALGPGLGPCLRVGATAARAIALRLRKPLVGVNHAIGHIEIGSLTSNATDPLTVLVSGGHTTITAFNGGRWRIYGETEDITLGNLLDMFAREALLPSPGGPQVEAMAKKSQNFIDLPYTVKGNDVSYSGLLTAAVRRLKEGAKREDLAFSLQEVAFSMLAEVAERSLAHTGKREILLTGGVAANESLQTKLKLVAVEQGVSFHVVDKRYTGDCGAQIAWTGALAHKKRVSTKVAESFVRPKWRLDHVDIAWRE